MLNRGLTRWLAGLGIALAALAPAGATAGAAAPPWSSVVISTDQVALGVRSDAALAAADVGLKYLADGSEGLLGNTCSCAGWGIDLAGVPTNLTTEDFVASGSTALSVMGVQDASGALVMRVTHDFHPAAGASNLYEVTVTVENLGDAPVQPSYARALTWATGLTLANWVAAPGTPPVDPTTGSLLSHDAGGVTFSLGLPVIPPGDAQVFRLYLGAGTTLGDVATGLTNNGASVLSQAAGGSHAFVFGSAAGAGPAVTGGGSGGAGGGSGGAGGGGSGGAGGGGGGAGGGGGGAGGGGLAGGGGGGLAGGGANGGGAGDVVSGAGQPATGSITGSQAAADTSVTPTPTPTDTSTSVVVLPAVPVAGLAQPGTGYASSETANGFSPSLPSAQATPELDAFALFGSGVLGMGAYALRRARAGRVTRRDEGGT